MNFHWLILFLTLLWSNFNFSISSSLTATLKIFLQSQIISDVRPHRLMNPCVACMKLSVFNNSTNSMFTAQTDIQAKMQPHRFTLDLFLMTYIGPKKSTKDRKKWGLPCSILNEGKVLMKCSYGLAFFCLHTVHLLVMSFIDTPSLITQNLCLIADNTYSVPKWGISWFHSQEAAIYCQKVLIDVLLNSRCLF